MSQHPFPQWGLTPTFPRAYRHMAVTSCNVPPVPSSSHIFERFSFTTPQVYPHTVPVMVSPLTVRVKFT